jgi:hypothetical protein
MPWTLLLPRALPCFARAPVREEKPMKTVAALVVASLALALAGCPDEKKDPKPAAAATATAAATAKPAASATGGW